MPLNGIRIYGVLSSMSTRIPSSLKWLMDKRARLDGKLKKAQSSMGIVQRLIADISNLQKDIEAIDRALGMHKIQVIPQNIKTISSCAKRSRLPWGELTRTLLLGLRLNKGEPLSTDALTFFVAERFASQYESTEDLKQLRLSVHYRLKNLARNNVITRPYPRVGRGGKWILPVTNDHRT